MKLSRTNTAGRAALAVPALLLLTLPLAACGGSSDSGSAGSGGSSATIGIVEQQLANPFFSKLQQAAVAEAKSKGLKVITAESKTAGDSESQVTAMENMIARKVKGIVLDPANASALAGVAQKARNAGILVITVNTTLEPQTASDATFETDNLAGGELIGKWAKVGLAAGQAPRVALLDYDLSDKTAKARHDGFLKGFGIADGSPEIAGTALTKASVDTGQTAMENLLSKSRDINVLYTINEPTAQGAFTAIKNKGLTGKVLVTSIDGSCSGVRSVADGTIGATVMQFPTKMGQLAVDAIAKFAADGTKPSGITNSGTTLITDKPVAGIESQTSAWGLDNCWGE